MIKTNYPYIDKLITDSEGHVEKVIINWNDYRRLIEAIGDEGFYKAMMEVKDEISLSLAEALNELDKEIYRYFP